MSFPRPFSFLKLFLFVLCFYSCFFPAFSFVSDSSGNVFFHQKVEFGNDVQFSSTFCSHACPSSATIPCSEPILSSCGDDCTSTGTALNINQCLENVPSTLCGEAVTDNCGNTCPNTGFRCEGSAICVHGLGQCVSLRFFAPQFMPAASCEQYFAASGLNKLTSTHAQVFIQNEELNGGELTEVDCYRNEAIYPGAWMLVRRRSNITTIWHPVNDNGQGDESYGTYIPNPWDHTQPGFSLKYSTVSYSRVLLISGDETRFLVLARENMETDPSTGTDCVSKTVMLSSDAHPLETTTLESCRRAASAADPQLSSNCNHTRCNDDASQGMLYAEGSLRNHWGLNLPRLGGYNLFIQ
eukprot:GCRY01000711.1.p1 GENE.GCRY01000711.1~~GCRY01000711.1.p1  ORF type:complete len:354 (+),score=49.82 GCRY01000711.1:142-1203(+)